MRAAQLTPTGKWVFCTKLKKSEKNGIFFLSKREKLRKKNFFSFDLGDIVSGTGGGKN
jgi:hypothetical protein